MVPLLTARQRSCTGLQAGGAGRAAAAAAAPAAAALAPPAGDDPWLAADKAQHLALCFAIVAAAHAALRGPPLRLGARAALALAAAAALLAALAKEAGDAAGLWPGRASARDLAADLLGVAAGAAAVLAAERAAAGGGGGLPPPGARGYARAGAPAGDVELGLPQRQQQQ